jgi:hypothetical protein
MSSKKDRITANLDTEDYQWVCKMAELTGTSQAGIIRQIVRGLRLGRPELLVFGNKRLVFAEEAAHTGGDDTVGEDKRDISEIEESGLESFTKE